MEPGRDPNTVFDLVKAISGIQFHCYSGSHAFICVQVALHEMTAQPNHLLSMVLLRHTLRVKQSGWANHQRMLYQEETIAVEGKIPWIKFSSQTCSCITRGSSPFWYRPCHHSKPLSRREKGMLQSSQAHGYKVVICLNWSHTQTMMSPFFQQSFSHALSRQASNCWSPAKM